MWCDKIIAKIERVRLQILKEFTTKLQKIARFYLFRK